MNIPEPLNCSDETTLRRIMEDYVYASENELAKTLKESTPSVDTEKGRIHIKEIIGSAQLSKTQCAVTWKETLWDEENSIPVSNETTDLVRNAIITYSNAQDDWYSSTIAMNTDGFKFIETNTVAKCKFDAAQFQKTVQPQLNNLNPETDETKIKNYFIANAFNNALAGYPCNDVIPLYKFNVGDYLSANSDLNNTFNSGDTTNTKGAIDHYRLYGLNENRVIRAQQKITPLSTTIKIQQPTPKNGDLDNASNACPTTSCDDLSVLFNIVDEYNNDPTAPGAIMLVTKANTAHLYKCDLEVNINYDTQVINSAGSLVQKGSFTYDDTGKEIPATKPPPKGTVNADKISLDVRMDVKTCKITYYGTDGPGSGTTIMPNTPPLHKPLEYATEVASSVMKPITGAMNTIGDAVSTAVESATSLFSTYRANTFASVGGISTLGGCPMAKCSDTVNLNAMMAFYKKLAPPDKQINNILRVGTLDDSTCDITFQEDTLVAGEAGKRSISISQTSALRFKMEPGGAPCTFNVKSMSSLFPAGPDEVLDMTNPLNSSACGEVFYVDTKVAQKEMANVCKPYKATVATKAQLASSQLAGADWCAPGWVADVSGIAFSPAKDGEGFGCTSGSGASRSGTSDLHSLKSSLAGVHCFGTKPDKIIQAYTGPPCTGMVNTPIQFQNKPSVTPSTPNIQIPFTQVGSQCILKCPADWNLRGGTIGGCWKINNENIIIKATDLKQVSLPENLCPPPERIVTYFNGNNNPIPNVEIGYTFTGSECVQKCPSDWDSTVKGSVACTKSVGPAQTDVVFIFKSNLKRIPKENVCPAPTTVSTTYTGGLFTKNPQPTMVVPYRATATQCIQECPSGMTQFTENGGGCNLLTMEILTIQNEDLISKPTIPKCPSNYLESGATCISTFIKPFSPAAWNQPGACTNSSVNYVNPEKEGFTSYGTPIQIRESTAPLKKMGFGSDRTRNSDTPALNTQYVEPLRQKTTLETAPGPKYIDADDSIKPEKANSYRYIRFRPIKTRNPNSYEVSVGKFRFFLGPNEIDMRNANVTNPMGTWVGDIGDVVGSGYTNGWSDAHKKALVFSFPYSILINGFTWTTANPDKGVDSDPVQWKLEGSDNGVYWVTLRNQTNHNYPVPKERFQELPIFRF
jgi:hypothetical protein